MQLTLFGIYLFLAIFNAGNMTTLQIQHYAIYPFVGKENFSNYMNANNKSALVPSILPAMLLLLVNIVLLFLRPSFLAGSIVIATLALNLIAFVSTVIWQRKLQGEMAVSGYDGAKAALLVSTNWIRTVAFLIQAVIAVLVTVNAIR